MNLTSKRMLQVLSACVGAVALTASATDWVSDSFEEMNAGDPAVAYGYEEWSGGVDALYKNQKWVAGAGNDASTIQENGVPYNGVGYPLSAAGHTKVLSLNTEGDTLKRFVNFTSSTVSGPQGDKTLYTPAPIPVIDGPIYLDTLMQFTPSEDDPTFTTADDETLHLAVWVNAESNLVVRHRYFLTSSEGPVGPAFPTNSVFTQLPKIEPGRWYRLTIQVDDSTRALSPGATLWTICSIFLDGEQLGHHEAFFFDTSLGGINRNGALFCSIGSHNSKTFSEIAFQGTGLVDDLVVTDSSPSFTAPTTVMLTLSWDNGIASVLAGGAAVNSPASIASGTVLDITAADWYQITGITGAVTYNGPIAAQQKTSSGTIIATAATTATIEASKYTDGGAFSTGASGTYATLDAGKLATWASLNGLTEAQFKTGLAGYIDDYLFNVAPGTDAKPVISSIMVDGSTVTIVVHATSPLVDYRDIIGILDVETCTTLGGVWTLQNIDPSAIAIDTADGLWAEITLTTANGSFIKAAIK